MVYWFLFITLKNFMPFSYFKGILQHYKFENWTVGQLEDSIFDATNRAYELKISFFIFEIYDVH